MRERGGGSAGLIGRKAGRVRYVKVTIGGGTV